MRIHDVSQPVGTGTAVWPGDQAFTLDWTMHQDRGDSVNVAALTLSVHTGTHVDAPRHVLGSGATAAKVPLDACIGPATVLDARGRDVLDTDLVVRFGNRLPLRVLFRTRDASDASSFPERVAAITPALADRLADAGVALVGTDAPSIDPLDSKTLEAHRMFATRGVAILENLVLDAVQPGNYFLVAVPLRLVEADASPVRALLLEGVRTEP